MTCICKKVRKVNPTFWDMVKDAPELTADMLVVPARSVGKDLVLHVYDYIYEHTESFEEDNIGADLAYAMAAILKHTYVEFPPRRPLVMLLREGFPPKHRLWMYFKETP